MFSDINVEENFSGLLVGIPAQAEINAVPPGNGHGIDTRQYRTTREHAGLGSGKIDASGY
jgi:hypothetical protein